MVSGLNLLFIKLHSKPSSNEWFKDMLKCSVLYFSWSLLYILTSVFFIMKECNLEII